RWYAEASARIDAERLKHLLLALVDIPSPTGAERAASEFVAAWMREHVGGARAFYQPIDEATGNAVAELRGSGGGATLMLYAPVDTNLEGDPDKDVPWAGPVLRRDMISRAAAEGDFVYGLGAANPKSMVATLAEIAAALSDAMIPIRGDLIVAFAGGGMPVDVAARCRARLCDHYEAGVARVRRGARDVLVQGERARHARLRGDAPRRARVPGFNRARGARDRGARGVDCAIHRAQQFGRDQGRRPDRGGARGLARAAGVSLGHDGNLSRPQMQSAHDAGRGARAVCRGDDRDRGAPSGGRGGMGDDRRGRRRRNRSGELDHPVVPARMGARRRASARRPAAAWRSDRWRVDSPDGDSVCTDRISSPAARLPAGVPPGAGRDGRRRGARSGPHRARDHVRGDRYADPPPRRTGLVAVRSLRAARASVHQADKGAT